MSTFYSKKESFHYFNHNNKKVQEKEMLKNYKNVSLHEPNRLEQWERLSYNEINNDLEMK